MIRRLALTLLAALLAVTPAAAFPDKPLELTALFGAGSAADLLARRLAELAGKDLGQPVAVVNRTGAGGSHAGRRRGADGAGGPGVYSRRRGKSALRPADPLPGRGP